MSEEALRQRPRQAPPSIALSGDELTAVLQEASRLQGEAMKQESEVPALKSAGNVFAIAEELGIPEEHVRAALATQRRKQQATGVGAAVPLLAAGAAGLVAGVGLGLIGVPALLAAPLGVLVAAGVFGVAFLAQLMKRNPAKAAGPPPVPGTCRVCFRPAHTPQSTFCEEHRYKPQG
jgi:hypothetical protein